jgi:fatty acid amide hydrolase
MSNDAADLTAIEMWSELERGRLSSVELVDALEKRARDCNPSVNALVHELWQQAKDEAARADEARNRGEFLGPLHGLPLTIKESIDIEGLPSTMGLGQRRVAATQDALSITAARAAGAIVVGKTNVPQTLLSPMETTNHRWGTTNNPWNPARSAGGSSGGEAAALATGMSVLGLGTDIGGSIRIPASYCGVAGIKPTVDRWSNLGSQTVLPGQELVRAQVGPMARTTADLAFLFGALDPEPMTRRDPRVPPFPPGDPESVEIARLRVGVYEDDGVITPAASCRRAVREAAEALEAAGAEVVPFRPPNAEELMYLYIAGLSADGGAAIEGALGRDKVIEPLKSLHLAIRMPTSVRRAAAATLEAVGERRLAKLLSSIGEKRVEALWALTARRTELQLEECNEWERRGMDLVLCPVHATPACPHGMSHDFTLGFCYSARYNLLNRPAGSVPVTRVRPEETTRPGKGDRLDRRARLIEAASEGLPVGVQIVGRPFDEHLVLAAMSAIEEIARENEGYPRVPRRP